MPAAAAPLYPAKTIAKLFNLTERRVQQLAKEGIIPKAERGKYELIGAVQGYVKYLQDRAVGQHEAAPTDLNAEKVRLTKAQADEKELQVKVLRGELLPAELVIEMGAALVAAARAKVLAIHSKCRSRFPSIEQDVADEIETLSREALSELGNDGLPADLRRRIAPASRRLESAAETDDQ